MEPIISTPYYLYEEKIILEQINKIANAKILKKNIHFSLMSNNNICLLNILKESGLGVFTSSVQELAIAKKAGFDNKKIIFCSSNLKIDEIKEVINVNPVIIADSFNQLNKYLENGSLKEIGIRISFEPEFYRKNNFLEIQRQGIEVDQLGQAIELCERHGVKIVGIHSYFGTNNSNEEFFKTGLSKLIDVSTQFKDLEFIDGSGGFGLDYSNEKFNFNLNELVRSFNDVLSGYPQLSGSIELKIEPGRFIMGPAGKLICTVTEVYEKQGRIFIGVDTNLSQFPRPYIYGEYHRIEVYKRIKKDKLKRPHTFIVGNSIKSDDFFAINIDFPKVEEGDQLCFNYAGAYCYSLSSNFCGQLRPAEYLLSENNEYSEIRTPESFSTLIKTQNPRSPGQ